MKQTHVTTTAPTTNTADHLAKKFPAIFDLLRRDITIISTHSVWNSMQQAGITEADLPAMEEAAKAPGFALIQKYISYWK